MVLGNPGERVVQPLRGHSPQVQNHFFIEMPLQTSGFHSVLHAGSLQKHDCSGEGQQRQACWFWVLGCISNMANSAWTLKSASWISSKTHYFPSYVSVGWTPQPGIFTVLRFSSILQLKSKYFLRVPRMKMNENTQQLTPLKRNQKWNSDFFYSSPLFYLFISFIAFPLLPCFPSLLLCSSLHISITFFFSLNKEVLYKQQGHLVCCPDMDMAEPKERNIMPSFGHSVETVQF